MYIQLYMAVSIDGFIAKPDDNTDWVSGTDWDNFREFIKEAGVIVMGRKTYEVSGTDFPYQNALNIVMTHEPTFLAKDQKDVLFTDKKPRDVVDLIKTKGLKKLLIIGGGKTNAAFLREKLVDEIILSVHPLVIGKGVKLFENEEFGVKLKLRGVKKLKEDLVQLRYKVLK